MTKPLKDYSPEDLEKLSIWIEDIREDLRSRIHYAERFLGHLPAKEAEFFSRLDKIIPDRKAKEPS